MADTELPTNRSSAINYELDLAMLVLDVTGKKLLAIFIGLCLGVREESILSITSFCYVQIAIDW